MLLELVRGMKVNVVACNSVKGMEYNVVGTGKGNEG
jgi:hypothetical protein